MIRVLDEKLKRFKFDMLLQHINYNEDEVAVALELIKEKRLKGIIFLGLNYYHPEGELEKINVPFVLGTVGSIFEDEDLSRLFACGAGWMKKEKANKAARVS